MKKKFKILSVILLTAGFAKATNTCATSCLTFNGLNTYVTTASSGSELGTSGTFEAWIYPTSSEGNNIIFCQSYSSTYTSQTLLRLTSSNYLELQNRQSNGSFLILTGTTAFSMNTWYHVAATWNTVSGTLTAVNLYINGCLEATLSNPSSYTWVTVNTYPLCIGGWDNAVTTSSGTGQYAFKGNIDEARVWDHARGQCEIIQNLEQLDFFSTGYSGLLSYYQFNEGSGTSVANLVAGGNYTGTLINSPTWVVSDAPVISKNALYAGCSPSFSGNTNSLQFNGINTYVTTASSGSELGTSGTLEAWIYPTSSEGNNMIFCQSYSSTFTSQTLLRLNSNNNLEIQNRQSNGTFLILTGTKTFSMNTWYHVAGTWSTASGTLTAVNLYINGCLEATLSSPSSYTWVTVNTYPLCIGGWDNAVTSSGGTGQYAFKGNIDEARVWSSTRQGCDLGYNMYNSVPANSANLTGYYKFNDGSGTTAVNSVAGGNYTGTLINSLLWSTLVASIDPTCSNGCRLMALGMNELHNNVNNFSIFPNPSNGLTTIKFTLYKKGKIEVNICEVNGQLVKTIKADMMEGENELKINTTDLANGVYLGTLTADSGSKHFKFINNK